MLAIWPPVFKAVEVKTQQEFIYESGKWKHNENDIVVALSKPTVDLGLSISLSYIPAILILVIGLISSKKEKLVIFSDHIRPNAFWNSDSLHVWVC